MKLQRVLLEGSLGGHHSAASRASGTTTAGAGCCCRRENSIGCGLRGLWPSSEVRAQPGREAAAEKDVAAIADGDPRIVRVGKARFAVIQSKLDAVIGRRRGRSVIQPCGESGFACDIAIAVVPANRGIGKSGECDIDV